MELLQLRNISKSFGGFRVLTGVSMVCRSSEVTCIIGPNGAGKTVLLNIISGVYPPDSGEIIFEGRDIKALELHERAKLGISRTFQIPRIFRNLTVFENLLVPALAIHGLTHREASRRAEEVLKLVKLEKLRDEPSKSLSGGQKKLLEIGRALMISPKLLLLDEPLAGVNPAIAEQIIDILKQLKARGLGIVLVCHETLYLKKIADRVIAISAGRIIAEGDVDEVVNSREVIESYLGRRGESVGYAQS